MIHIKISFLIPLYGAVNSYIRQLNSNLKIENAIKNINPTLVWSAESFNGQKIVDVEIGSVYLLLEVTNPSKITSDVTTHFWSGKKDGYADPAHASVQMFTAIDQTINVQSGTFTSAYLYKL